MAIMLMLKENGAIVHHVWQVRYFENSQQYSDVIWYWKPVGEGLLIGRHIWKYKIIAREQIF